MIPLIAGNWKMHMTVAEASDLVKGIHYGLRFPGQVEVVVAPPFTALFQVGEFLKDSYIGMACQNIHWEEKGAFTGEISASLAKDAGADYVIIGHSERRQFFGETNETVNKKVKATLKHGLIPILCVGETLSERESGSVSDVIEQQIFEGLKNISIYNGKDIVVAYEPVWAIGTGRTATPDQAEEVHALIRSLLCSSFGSQEAEEIRILYGGSMNPSNSKELLSQPNINGGLIGGASLKADSFIEIIKSIPK